MKRRYSDIGNRLRQVREALGISQADLCRSIFIAPNRWNQYESGERQITIEIARRLREAHGITLDYIYANDASSLPMKIGRKIRAA